MIFPGFLPLMSFAIPEKTFPPALALTANRFTVLFDYVPLTVTDGTNHFILPVSSTYDAIKRVALTELAYTLFQGGWQEKKTNGEISLRSSMTVQLYMLHSF